MLELPEFKSLRGLQAPLFWELKANSNQVSIRMEESVDLYKSLQGSSGYLEGKSQPPGRQTFSSGILCATGHCRCLGGVFLSVQVTLASMTLFPECCQGLSEPFQFVETQTAGLFLVFWVTSIFPSKDILLSTSHTSPRLRLLQKHLTVEHSFTNARNVRTHPHPV